MSKRTAATKPWDTGAAVAELLGESNRAKASAAMAMGTTITTLYRWMRQPEWPQRNIEKAAAYFGVAEEWLLTGRGEKYVAPSGGSTPQDARAEQLYLRMERQMQVLLKKYTREVAKLYSADENTPSTPKGTQREWNSRPSEDL